MSDDLINQLTLNFLISKNQLQKLNKKVKENTTQQKISEIEKYNNRIKLLFNDLLVYKAPDDLLLDVKNSFDAFIEKSIYYFQAHDKTIELENERNQDFIKEDIDYEREEREIEKGNYHEEDEDVEEEEEDLEEKDIEEKDMEEIKKKPYIPKNVNKEPTQKLPLDWFQNARNNYQKNKIIPRKKEIKLEENQISNLKRKI